MDSGTLREDMVDSLEHEAKGLVHSEQISVAMRAVPREAFLADQREAYADRPHECLGTRVLSPSTAARLLEALSPEPGDAVLVVGVGVGYTAAVLASIVGEAQVHAVDIDRRLVIEARRNLADAGYSGVLVVCRDGAKGLPNYGPYDRVLVEAAAVNPPPPLIDQLSGEGRLVMPLGSGDQSLAAINAEGTIIDQFGPVRFEPMLVAGEEATTIERNRTVREERERAERAAKQQQGWKQDWIDWEAAGWERRGPGGR